MASCVLLWYSGRARAARRQPPRQLGVRLVAGLRRSGGAGRGVETRAARALRAEAAVTTHHSRPPAFGLIFFLAGYFVETCSFYI